jgi:hypothetical protein
VDRGCESLAKLCALGGWPTRPIGLIEGASSGRDGGIDVRRRRSGNRADPLLRVRGDDLENIRGLRRLPVAVDEER